jgi:hypothetical protein
MSYLLWRLLQATQDFLQSRLLSRLCSSHVAKARHMSVVPTCSPSTAQRQQCYIPRRSTHRPVNPRVLLDMNLPDIELCVDRSMRLALALP